MMLDYGMKCTLEIARYVSPVRRCAFLSQPLANEERQSPVTLRTPHSPVTYKRKSGVCTIENNFENLKRGRHEGAMVECSGQVSYFFMCIKLVLFRLNSN